MNLMSYYELNFSLMQYHKYSLTEIENWIPWERDIYVGMLQNHLESEKLTCTNSPFIKLFKTFELIPFLSLNFCLMS